MGGYSFRKPCLGCGVLSRGTKCGDCEGRDKVRKGKLRETNERKEKKRQYYNADYKRRAKLVRATATLCHICKRGPLPNDPFQADHIEPGDANSGLLPAHRSCNARRGNKPL